VLDLMLMCRKEEMVEEAEKKLRWVETILSVMDLVIPGMFRNSRKATRIQLAENSALLFKKGRT
jgi:hypothetical protein